MAYDDNGRLRSESELRANNENIRGSSSSYIVTGIIALAVVLGVIFMLPHRTDNEVVNGRPTATTTGAGSTSPAMPARPAPPAAPGAPATR